MPLKKKGSSKTARTSAKKTSRRKGNRWSVILLIIVALAIPVTMLLVTQSQDLRQNAAETYLNATVVTTIPKDTLRISISQEDGTAIENPQKQGKTGTNKGTQKGEQTPNSGQSGECTKEEIREVTENGTKTDIRIDCSGGSDYSDQSGSDGSGNIQNPKSGKDSTLKKSGGNKGNNALFEEDGKGKKDKDGKDKKKKNLIQQFIDRIRARLR